MGNGDAERSKGTEQREEWVEEQKAHGASEQDEWDPGFTGEESKVPTHRR